MTTHRPHGPQRTWGGRVQSSRADAMLKLSASIDTGRTRNDQVATDLGLWERRDAAEIGERIDALSGVLLDRADEHVTTLLPGYTHLQRAQPIRLAHPLLAWFEMLRRDRGRLD